MVRPSGRTLAPYRRILMRNLDMSISAWCFCYEINRIELYTLKALHALALYRSRAAVQRELYTLGYKTYTKYQLLNFSDLCWLKTSWYDTER